MQYMPDIIIPSAVLNTIHYLVHNEIYTYVYIYQRKTPWYIPSIYICDLVEPLHESFFILWWTPYIQIPFLDSLHFDKHKMYIIQALHWLFGISLES